MAFKRKKKMIQQLRDRVTLGDKISYEEVAEIEIMRVK